MHLLKSAPACDVEGDRKEEGRVETELTVVDEIHKSGRCTDTDASSVVLEELDLLLNFHMLGELVCVSDIIPIHLRDVPISRLNSLYFETCAPTCSKSVFLPLRLSRSSIPDNVCSSQTCSCNNEGMRRSLLLRRLLQPLRVLCHLLQEVGKLIQCS